MTYKIVQNNFKNAQLACTACLHSEINDLKEILIKSTLKEKLVVTRKAVTLRKYKGNRESRLNRFRCQ